MQFDVRYFISKVYGYFLGHIVASTAELVIFWRMHIFLLTIHTNDSPQLKHISSNNTSGVAMQAGLL